MAKLKVDFWKCRDCDMVFTLRSEAIQHSAPQMIVNNGKLEISRTEVHHLTNQKNGELLQK